ncbi:heat-inducible transcriptional repressor HrcA [Bifidobacterium sp. SO1]|uniref:heat-inducible transcriptional repressor HrcA n=1 Tax=Bifidobacterium sp. SO1 TaxID=2809029 RepID=UPI001BDCBB6B|nr:heat-inducible transcriptional repressor HrcA [Bifidobacterium sp. SO1]MBT1162496.1 heat-inducible transcriptional repressor HrcA [Bifidobacterium sp. SO1]
MTQSRRMLVLRAVVEDYIRSQEPIGSSSLTKTHDLGVSSATIRNDMAALEDEGYLIQPHTSAGRIPTEKGYRYFVDRLATVMPLSKAQRNGIATFLSGSVNLQDTLQRAARLLSQITGQVAVVASPSLSKATLRHVEIVPVSLNVLLAVVITDTGRVAQHTLPVRRMPQPDELSGFCEAVNRQCAAMSFAKAAERVRALGSAGASHDTAMLSESLACAFEGMADDERANELYMAGTSHLANQAATADLAPLFDALEEQVVLMRLMSTLSEESTKTGVGVAIGSETHTPGLMHVSVVTSGYGRSSDASDKSQPRAGRIMDDAPVPDDAKGRQKERDGDGNNEEEPGQTGTDEPIAFVGSIGPTHMDYAATIAAVRAVARYLTVSLASGGRESS